MGETPFRGPGPPAGRALERFMGVGSGIAISVGIIVGSGIFRVPARIAATLGSPGLVALVWGFGGLLTLAGALTLAEPVTLFPETGGIYVVLRQAWGRLPAFLFGWAHLVAIKSAATAAISVVACEYLGRMLDLPASTVRPMAIALIALLASTSALSARHGSRLQNLSTGAKLAALAALTLLGLLGPIATHAPGAADRVAESAVASIAHPMGAVAVMLAVVTALEGVLWTYDGWADVAPVAGEVRDPSRNLPRILIGSSLLVIALYMGANLAFLRVLGLEGVVASRLVGADVAAVSLGETGVRLASVAVFVSVAGAVNGSIIAGPRIFFAMARDGLFFRAFGRCSGRGTPSPALAIGLQAAWAIGLVLLGGFEALSGYFVFVTWLTYAAAGASVFRLRSLYPDLPRPFRVPGYPFLPAIFVLFAVAYLVATLLRGSREALAGAAIVAAGVPVYFVWRWRSPPPRESSGATS